MPCGCLGCSDEPVAIVAHPSGRRAVCEDHTTGYDVIERIDGEEPDVEGGFPDV